jgi:hypothetical protein
LKGSVWWPYLISSPFCYLSQTTNYFELCNVLRRIVFFIFVYDRNESIDIVHEKYKYFHWSSGRIRTFYSSENNFWCAVCRHKFLAPTHFWGTNHIFFKKILYRFIDLGSSFDEFFGKFGLKPDYRQIMWKG